MTCVAWDGTRLAADSRMTVAGMQCTTSKLHHGPNKSIFAASGDGPAALALEAWVFAGRLPEDFPYALVTDKEGEPKAKVLVIDFDLLRDSKGVIEVAPLVKIYEGSPHPRYVVDKFFAMGSGRDYAMAAMFLGKTAPEAVEVACHFDVYCGNGVTYCCAPLPEEFDLEA